MRKKDIKRNHKMYMNMSRARVPVLHVASYMAELLLKPKIKKNQFQCSACGGIFDKGWSDKDALHEFRESYPTMPMEEAAIICDDCFKVMSYIIDLRGLNTHH